MHLHDCQSKEKSKPAAWVRRKVQDQDEHRATICVICVWVNMQGVSSQHQHRDKRKRRGWIDLQIRLCYLALAAGSWRRVVAQCDTNVIFRPRRPAIHSQEANLALYLVCAALSEPSGGEGALESAGSARATYSYTGISWVGGTDGTLYCSRPSYNMLYRCR